MSTHRVLWVLQLLMSVQTRAKLLCTATAGLDPSLQACTPCQTLRLYVAVVCRDFVLDGDPSPLFQAACGIMKLQHMYGLIPRLQVRRTPHCMAGPKGHSLRMPLNVTLFPGCQSCSCMIWFDLPVRFGTAACPTHLIMYLLIYLFIYLTTNKFIHLFIN
jgi:hypothetical protein